ncbi:hypothetical protein KM043_005478 [Ampulex compressa]|nr:hypothetical protein KM043_005478 [Ampulex compressa]
MRGKHVEPAAMDRDTRYSIQVCFFTPASANSCAFLGKLLVQIHMSFAIPIERRMRTVRQKRPTHRMENPEMMDEEVQFFGHLESSENLRPLHRDGPNVPRIPKQGHLSRGPGSPRVRKKRDAPKELRFQHLEDSSFTS